MLAASPAMPPSHQIYANQLGPLHHGFPLWIPEPSDGKEVKVGDVGHLLEGQFHRLFSASCPESERVPSGFSALRLPGPWGDDSLDEDTVAQLIPPGTVRSESVRETKIGFSAETGPSLPGNAAVTYSCSRQQGAVLHLSHPAKLEHTLALGTFEEYILKNHTSWLDFAKSRGRRIKETDLILVTGVVKTYGWSAASFHESNSSISFHIKSFAGGPSVGLSFSGKWEEHTSVAKRCYTEPPVGEQPRANQAIFLRGFKMKQRFPLSRSLVPEQLKAEAEPVDLPSYRDNDDPPAVPSGAMEIDTQYAISETYHPSDALLDYILQHSDAEVAIVHDDHWCGRTKHPLIPDDVDVTELVREYAESFFARQSAEHSQGFKFDDDSDLDAMDTDSDLQSTRTAGTSALPLHLADPSQIAVAGTSMLLDPPPVAPQSRSVKREYDDSDLGVTNTYSAKRRSARTTGTSTLPRHRPDTSQIAVAGTSMLLDRPQVAPQSRSVDSFIDDSYLAATSTYSDLRPARTTGTSALPLHLADTSEFAAAGTSMLLYPPPVAPPQSRSVYSFIDNSGLGPYSADLWSAQTTGTSALPRHRLDTSQIVASTSMLLDPRATSAAPRSGSWHTSNGYFGFESYSSDLQSAQTTGTSTWLPDTSQSAFAGYLDFESYSTNLDYSALPLHLADTAEFTDISIDWSLPVVGVRRSRSVEDVRRSEKGRDCPQCGRKDIGIGEWRFSDVMAMMVCTPCGSYESRTGRLRPPELEQRRSSARSRRRSP